MYGQLFLSFEFKLQQNDPIKFTSTNSMLMQSSDLVLSSSNIMGEQVKLFSENDVKVNSIGLNKAPSANIYSPNISFNPLGSGMRHALSSKSPIICIFLIYCYPFLINGML